MSKDWIMLFRNLSDELQTNLKLHLLELTKCPWGKPEVQSIKQPWSASQVLSKLPRRILKRSTRLLLTLQARTQAYFHPELFRTVLVWTFLHINHKWDSTLARKLPWIRTPLAVVSLVLLICTKLAHQESAVDLGCSLIETIKTKWSSEV